MKNNELKINEYKIKLLGTACIPQDLKLEQDIDLTIGSAETTSRKDIPTGDGNFDRVISIRITERSEVNILAENDIIQARRKGSMSQRLRMKIYELYEQQYSGDDKYKDSEDFYQKQIQNYIEQINNQLL